MAYQPAPIDNPWHPQWDPRYLPCLTRPDPRYYRYVPDLSCYFVVAHHQSADWQPGEGHPSSIRWLRNAAPELVAPDGRLATPVDDVTRGQPTSTAEASAIFGPPPPPRESRRSNAPSRPSPGPPPEAARERADVPETRGRPLSRQGVTVPTGRPEPDRPFRDWSENTWAVPKHAAQTHRSHNPDAYRHPDDKLPREQANQHRSDRFAEPSRAFFSDEQEKPDIWSTQARNLSEAEEKGFGWDTQARKDTRRQRSSDRESYWTPKLTSKPAPYHWGDQQSQSWGRPQPNNQTEDDHSGRPRDFSGSYDSEQQPHTATTATTRKVSGSSGEQEHGSSGFWPETTEISDPDEGHVRRADPDVLRKAHELPLGHVDSPWCWPEKSDTPPPGGAHATREEENDAASKLPKFPSPIPSFSEYWQPVNTPVTDAYRPHEPKPDGEQQRPDPAPPTPSSQSSDLSHLADYYERLALQCRTKTISAREARAAAAAAAVSSDRRRQDQNLPSQPREDDQNGNGWGRGRWNSPVPKRDSRWNMVPRSPSPSQKASWGSGCREDHDNDWGFSTQTPGWGCYTPSNWQ